MQVQMDGIEEVLSILYYHNLNVRLY